VASGSVKSSSFRRSHGSSFRSFLELDNQEVMSATFTLAVMHDDIRQYFVCCPSQIAICDAHESFLDLTISIVLAVHILIPAETLFHVHCKSVGD
jgi:hypothetical protein